MNTTTLAFFVLCFAATVYCAPKCSKSRKNAADRCAKEAMFFQNPEIIPKDVAGAEDYCKNTAEKSLKCVQKYGTDCLKGFAAQAMRIGVNGMKKVKTHVCKGPAERKAFTDNVKWMDEEKSDKLGECMTKNVANIEYISKNVKSDDQIPESCCSYWLFRKCFSDKVKEIAPKSSINYMHELLDSGTKGLVDFLCAKQNSVETCKQLMPESMKRMTAVYTSTDKQNTELKSFLLPFLEVIIN